MSNQTKSEFRELLASSGLAWQQLQAFVQQVSGRNLPKGTINGWMYGASNPPPCAFAIIYLLKVLSPARRELLIEEVQAVRSRETKAREE